MSDLVTIALFPDAMTAHMFRSRLESEGIFAVVVGDGLLPGYNGAKQVRVLVDGDDAEEALKIKKQCDKA